MVLIHLIGPYGPAVPLLYFVHTIKTRQSILQLVIVLFLIKNALCRIMRHDIAIQPQCEQPASAQTLFKMGTGSAFRIVIGYRLRTPADEGQVGAILKNWLQSCIKYVAKFYPEGF